MFVVGRERLTGRLFPPSIASNELRVVEGRPTYVYSASPRLQLPQFLVDEAIVEAERIPPLVEEMVKAEKPLVEIVRGFVGAELPDLWTMCMERRLLELVHTCPSLCFEECPPGRLAPFAAALTSTLRRLVHEALPLRDLYARLGDRITKKLERNDSCAAGLMSLELDRVELLAAGHLANGRPIAAWIDEYPELETLYLYLGYLLLETDLFRIV